MHSMQGLAVPVKYLVQNPNPGKGLPDNVCRSNKAIFIPPLYLLFC
jgi:hypothetical protein